MSNSAYKNEFFYVGANISERENIIEDGYAKSENKEHEEQENQVKYEQSDLLMILMNISFIPDEICYQNVMRDFEPGWQYYLKQAMQNFKEDFNKNVVESGKPKELWFKAEKVNKNDYKCVELEYNEVDEDKRGAPNYLRGGRTIDILTYDTKWEYQNRELEDRYETFKKRRDLVLQPNINNKAKTLNIKKIISN